jgi:hypothetical protein
MDTRRTRTAVATLGAALLTLVSAAGCAAGTSASTSAPPPSVSTVTEGGTEGTNTLELDTPLPWLAWETGRADLVAVVPLDAITYQGRSTELLPPQEMDVYVIDLTKAALGVIRGRIDPASSSFRCGWGNGRQEELLAYLEGAQSALLFLENAGPLKDPVPLCREALRIEPDGSLTTGHSDPLDEIGVLEVFRREHGLSIEEALAALGRFVAGGCERGLRGGVRSRPTGNHASARSRARLGGSRARGA